MDIDLSAADLAFRDDVRNFLKTNVYKPGTDYTVWRDQWFAKAKAKGGWDVTKWPKQFGGPGWTPTQHYIWEQETATAVMPFDMPFGVGMLAATLKERGLIRSTRAKDDARHQHLNLTAAGRRAFAPLDEGSRRDIGALLDGLPEIGRAHV